ncbi:MAG: hypothetical protein JWN86_3722 [Planctomycetota bacterium]|nr:hypothetical protein [Planctomycetota bacterium]
MIFKVVVEQGDEGYIVASCPSLRACVSQGKTREEAIANIREAIELYLEPSPNELAEREGREVLELTL